MSRKWEDQIVVCDGCGHDTPRRSMGKPYLCWECEMSSETIRQSFEIYSDEEPSKKFG